MIDSSCVDTLNFGPDGLIPTIVQDVRTGQVLMLAYMNKESLENTLSEGRTCFWNRSRSELWVKGETSGNYQIVKEIAFDCDKDALLVQVEQIGVACHTGSMSCFAGAEVGGRRAEQMKSAEPAQAQESSFDLTQLYQVIQDRKARQPENSYTARLISSGQDRVLKKIAEEAGEVMLASRNNDRNEIVSEMADLWFHSLLVLAYHDIPPQAVLDELDRRRR